MTGSDPAIVRGTRIELVDDQGNVRMVLGALRRREGAEGAFGVSVLDAEGAARLWLALEPTGPALVFDLDGNAVLHVGVDDPASDGERAGAFVHLADGTGTPVLDVLVDADGTVTIEKAEDA